MPTLMKAKAHTVHRLLGRVRFSIPDRRGDRAFFDELGTRLGRRAAAGVHGLRGQQPVLAVSLVWYAAELIRHWGRPHPSAAA